MIYETVKALILSTGTPVPERIEPAFEPDKARIIRVLGAKMKNQAFDFAGEYRNEHKEALIQKGLQTALRV